METLQEMGHRQRLWESLYLRLVKTAFMDTRLMLQAGLDQLTEQPWQQLRGNLEPYKSLIFIQ